MTTSMKVLLLVAVAALTAEAIPAHGQTQPEVFSASVYLAIHPDLMNVYGAGSNQSALNHWLCCGIGEGRRASVIFDPVYYLNHYPDLLAAFGPTGYQQALQHFIVQGLPNEGRRGSAEFDVQYYLANNSDLLAAFGPTGYAAAADHFLNWGLPAEGRKGSADFDVKAYFAIYPDINAAYGATDYTDGMLHWLRRGKGQGRRGIGSPAISTECQGPRPAGFARVYIGFPASGPGTGTAANPFDGSTQMAFDGLLRNISEQTAPIPIDPETGNAYSATNLIVCLAPGTFQTVGNWDWVIAVGHTLGTPGTASNPGGFTLNRNWHFHGAGADKTVMRLAKVLPNPPLLHYPPNTGFGEVFGTHDDNASGIEISDLTIDDNYPALKVPAMQGGVGALNLLAIVLRADLGNHWIHRVNIINASGELGLANEAFPVLIQSVKAGVPDGTARDNNNNLIEYVVMSNFGANTGTAITIANAVAEVRYNVVNGAGIAYGGWDLGLAYFHDNFAIDSNYGFNIDSLKNNGTMIDYNDIMSPRSYGIVLGGPSPYTFTNMTLLYNTITLSNSGSFGLILQGNVTNSIISRTNFVCPPFLSGLGIYVKGGGNFGNDFQYNQIASSLGIAFVSPSTKGQNCVFGNWNEAGTARSDFTNTVGAPCVPGL
jgi:hypothetical protein